MSARHWREKYGLWLAGGLLGALAVAALPGCGGSSGDDAPAKADAPRRPEPVRAVVKGPDAPPPARTPLPVTVRGKIVLTAADGSPLPDWKVAQVQFGSKLAKLDGNNFEVNIVPDEWPVSVFIKDPAGQLRTLDTNYRVADVVGQAVTITCPLEDAGPVKEDPSKPVTVRGQVVATKAGGGVTDWKVDQVLFGTLPAKVTDDSFEITVLPGDYEIAVRFKSAVSGGAYTGKLKYHVQGQEGQHLTLTYQLPGA